MDGKHMIFGEILEGHDVAHEIQLDGTDKGHVRKTCIITNSGVIEDDEETGDGVDALPEGSDPTIL